MTQLSSEKPELFKGRHFNHLLIIQAEGDVPKIPISARGSDYSGDHPDPAWLGELLSDWLFGAVLQLHSTVGRKEDQATPDACAQAQRLRLEEVE